MKENTSKRYNSINGLRTIACLGILLMHINSNIDYTVGGNVFNIIVSEFGNFVLLFMIISAFSMCCGYYEKVKNKQMDMEEFYKRRFKKVFPFFALLLVIDVVYEHNINSLIEAFANSTLMFGFLQKEISVVGVSWFLGLVFIFYMIFPFYVSLFSNKKRAWIVSFIALLMNWVSIYYFQVEKTNMFYSFIYFCIGGLLYLYKESIIGFLKKRRIVNIILILCAIIAYYLLPSNDYLLVLKVILLCVSLISYAITFDSKLLNNKATKFISGISLEIYLSHMVIFRIVEKLHLTHIVNNNNISYLILCIVVFCGTVAFSKLFQIIQSRIGNKIKRKK